MPLSLFVLLLSILGFGLFNDSGGFLEGQQEKTAYELALKAGLRGDLLPWQSKLLGQKVDLNGVGRSDLQRLNGLGRVLANRILSERQRRQGFKNWNQVDGVPGVGARMLARLQTHFFINELH